MGCEKFDSCCEMSIAVLSACSLNQSALDFSGNYDRILQSILLSKASGSVYRSGPELEITYIPSWFY